MLATFLVELPGGRGAFDAVLFKVRSPAFCSQERCPLLTAKLKLEGPMRGGRTAAAQSIGLVARRTLLVPIGRHPPRENDAKALVCLNDGRRRHAYGGEAGPVQGLLDLTPWSFCFK